MALHITRWRPDTCGCVLELQWDDEEAPEVREHVPVKVERCGAHMDAAPQHEAVFNLVLAENQHKNEVAVHLLESMGSEFVETIGDGGKQFKSAPRYEYDSGRTLRVTFADAPAADAARTALEARAFGRAVEIV